jgi:Fic family protein
MKHFDYQKIRGELFTPDIVNLIAAIHEYKGKQELYMTAKPDVLSAMLDIAKIQSTGASNRIEGIYTSEARLTQLVRHKAEPKNRDEQEIAGYREVLSTIHESYEYIVPRSNVILQLHRDLYSYNPTSVGGRYKNVDNIIEEMDNQGQKRVRFQPLSAFETPDAIERLCHEFLLAIDTAKIDSLLLISMFILDFLCIHPFKDGNGRMSRLLTLLLLYREGYIAGKYISLEMMIEKTKESYYETLEQSSSDWHTNENNYAPFVSYYLSVILAVYKEFESRVALEKTSGVTKADRIRLLISNTFGQVTKAKIAEKCPDISITTIEKTLADLLKQDLIKKVGVGRATAYVWNEK